ncbi:MAG: hypothetical protein LBD35_03650 [Prevotellaceae bacterium]|jgi:hypothetical protein|nr:hypothetical protein [Prevotellaceae bacterium]
MTKETLSLSINFIVLILLQAFLFNAMYLGVYVSLQLYLMFIIFLPAKLPAITVMVLAAITGITTDLLSSGDIGLHLAACVAMAYIRPFMLSKTSPTDIQFEIPDLDLPHFSEYLLYVGILVLMHHSVLFIFESLSFKEFGYIVARICASAAVNIFLICVIKSIPPIVKHKKR